MTATEAASPARARRDRIALLVLLVAVLWPFRDTLVGDGCMLAFDTRRTGFAPFQVDGPADVDARPANLVTSDIVGWIAPEMELCVRELRAGRLPLWNPYVLCGQPLLANLAFAAFYPPQWLALVVDPLRALAWVTVLHFWLAGAFVYAWSRGNGVGQGGSLAAALAASLSTWLTTRFHLPAIAMTAAWFPGMLLALERLIDRRTAGAAAALAACIGGAALAGFPQVFVLELVGLAVYGIVRLVQDRPPLARTFALAGGAVVVGGTLGAIHLWPAAALFAESLRSTFAAEVAAHGLRPAALAGLVHPYAFGDPVTLLREVAALHEYLPHRLWLGPDVQENAVENALWLGALPLALAAAGIAAALARVRVAWAPIATIAVGFALACGLPLPGLETGSPKRALVLAMLPAAMLVGIGFDAVRASRGRAGLVAGIVLGLVVAIQLACALVPDAVVAALVAGRTDAGDADVASFARHLAATSRWPLAVGVASALALFLLARRGALAPFACAVVIAADLGAYARQFNPAQERAGQYASTPAVAFARDSGERTVRAFDASPLPASYGPMLGYRSLDGAEPMVTRRIAQLLDAIEPGRFDARDPRVMRPFTDLRAFASPAFLRTATSLVVANRELPLERADVVYANEAEGMGMYRLRDALPRARLVAGAEYVPSAEARVAALLDPARDPRRVVLLELALDAGSSGPRDPPAGAVRVVAETPGEVEIAIEGLDRDAWLVLADTYDDGWRARRTGADGSSEDVDVLVADHAFRAIRVGPETRRVTFRYEPDSFEAGALASAIAALVIAAAALRARRRARP